MVLVYKKQTGFPFAGPCLSFPLFIHRVTTMRVTNRFVAFAIHLGVSLLMFLVLAAIIKFVWYPGVLFDVEGGWDGIKLIAGVDLIIGPTLTLMVYNIAKKELKRDLAIIGLLQAAYIVGGMTVVGSNRPVAVVYAAGMFFTMTNVRLEMAKIDVENVPLLNQPKPARINIKLPENKDERSKALTHWVLTAGGLDIATPLYSPFTDALKTMPTDGSSIEQAESFGYMVPEQLKNDPTIRVFELQTRYGLYRVATNITTGEIVSILKKNPQAENSKDEGRTNAEQSNQRNQNE